MKIAQTCPSPPGCNRLICRKKLLGEAAFASVLTLMAIGAMVFDAMRVDSMRVRPLSETQNASAVRILKPVNMPVTVMAPRQTPEQMQNQVIVEALARTTAARQK